MTVGLALGSSSRGSTATARAMSSNWWCRTRWRPFSILASVGRPIGPLGDLSLGEPSRVPGKSKLRTEYPVLRFDLAVDRFVIHKNIVGRV